MNIKSWSRMAALGAICALAASPVSRREPSSSASSASSRPFAEYGQQIYGGMKAYMKLHGDTVAGKKIEVIHKDTTGPRPRSPNALPRSWSCRTTSIFWRGSG